MKALPALPAERRQAAAETYVARHKLGPEVATEVLAVMAQFAGWFAEAGLAEVSVAAPDFRGVSDRLVVSEAEILVLDYKSDRAPPADAANVKPEYLRQLARYAAQVSLIYPGKTVKTALLWTATLALMEIPVPALAANRGA